jgi:hypothetical protein
MVSAMVHILSLVASCAGTIIAARTPGVNWPKSAEIRLPKSACRGASVRLTVPGVIWHNPQRMTASGCAAGAATGFRRPGARQSFTDPVQNQALTFSRHKSRSSLDGPPWGASPEMKAGCLPFGRCPAFCYIWYRRPISGLGPQDQDKQPDMAGYGGQKHGEL